MIRMDSRFGRIIVLSFAILILSGCSATHKELRTYRSINHLAVPSITDMALQTMRLMGYQIQDWNDSAGYVYGIKPIDFRYFRMTVNVTTDSQGDRSLEVKCIADQVPLGPSDKEVQKFHELFNKLARRSALPAKDAARTAPASSTPEQEPKGFE